MRLYTATIILADITNVNDAALDKYNDNYSNLQEYQAGTDPQDPSSKPGTSTSTCQTGSITINNGTTYNGGELIQSTIGVTSNGTVIIQNGVADIFLYHLPSGTQHRISYQQDGSETLQSSNNPAIAGEMPYLVFDKVDENQQHQIYEVSITSDKTANTSPNSQWILILDQLNAHKSESLVRWIAEECQIDKRVGEKRKRRCIKIHEDQNDLFYQYRSSNSFCLHTETLFQAKPG